MQHGDSKIYSDTNRTVQINKQNMKVAPSQDLDVRQFMSSFVCFVSDKCMTRVAFR